jgi:steroid 5-alpha reductase family enzyme
MIRTIIVLLITLIALPVVAIKYDQPLNEAQMHLLTTAATAMVCVALLCFVVSELTRNYSQVDKLWSVLPIFYAGYFAWASGWDARLTLMAAVAAIWGIRLTYNFGRRGGYSWIPWQGEEDYRWSVLRQKPFLQGRLRWGLFNLFFVSLYQQSLILLFTLPSVAAHTGAPLQWLDWAAAGAIIALVIIEGIADQQQYDFQTEKYRRIKAGQPLDGEYAGGFASRGLWAWSRHPNYAAEQSIWLCYYLFSVAATGRWLNWSLAGGLLLMLLFLGSSNFSEKISEEKYPAYREYQTQVPRFWPWWKLLMKK